MIVVSNTTPINYLVLIGCESILPGLYGRLIIPEAVYAELTRPGTPEQVRKYIDREPEWLEVRSAPETSTPTTLDRGEHEAIELAIAANADLILLDERRARTAAGQLKLSVIGTL